MSEVILGEPRLSPRRERSRHGRDLGLDAARGIALLSMFVAHFAPSAGPLGVLNLSEHLTAFLFVLLIGCGAELGRSSSHRWRSSQVRAAVLVVLGLALMQLPSGILVVLVWLGVLTLLAPWVAAWRTPWVLLLGVAALALAPELMENARTWLLESYHDPVTVGAADLLLTGPDYRVVSFVPALCAGVLLVRYAATDRARLLVAAACLPVAAVLFLLDQVGDLEVEAYTGTHAELVFNVAIALLATTVTWVVAPRLRQIGEVLAAAGAMALTVYTLQVLADWAYLRPGGRDDNQWSILVGACVVTLLLAAAWTHVRRATGWRGPLEGLVDRWVRGSAE